MGIDIEAALKAPFGKRMHFGNYLLASILMIIPIVNLFFGVVYCGAMVKYIRAVVKGEEADFSIFDDKKSSFEIGAKSALGAFVLSLPLFVLFFIFCMFLNIDAGNILLAISSLYLLLILMSFIFMLFCPIMMMNFSLDLKFVSMIDFQRAAFLFKGNPKGYFVTLIFAFLVSLIYGIAFSIPLLGLIAALFLYIPFVLSINNIFGQYLKENKAVDVIKRTYRIN